jgi:hypothetical protein
MLNWVLLFLCLSLGVDAHEFYKSPGNKKGIAIDLGARDGAEMAKWFHRVIAVGPDLEISRSNVISVNRSIVQVRNEPSTMTFKELLFETIYSNGKLKASKVLFVNCDMGGAEEEILEDVLHYAYNHGAKVCVTFRADRWKAKSVADFGYLFEFFQVNCPSDVATYLEGNPGACLLFEPKRDGAQLFKKNMTAVVIGFNQYTYIRDMVRQLEKYTNDIVVVDNNSQYGPLLDYYRDEYRYTLLKMGANFGHTVYNHPAVWNLAGDVYIVTDPDLEFNSRLPANFIEVLIGVSNYYKSGRVGFALLIDSDEIRLEGLLFAGKEGKGLGVKEFEKRYWVDRRECGLYPELELYQGSIDTTFNLYNLRYAKGLEGIRVAGDYTCLHLPWFKNFKERLLPGEFEFYSGATSCSTWVPED